MPRSYFSSRINVERTGAQNYLGQCNSQKRGRMINKCRVVILGRMLYKRRRSPWPRDRKQGEEKDRKKRKELEIKSRRYSPTDCYSKSLEEYPYVQLVAWLVHNYVSSVKDLVL